MSFQRLRRSVAIFGQGLDHCLGGSHVAWLRGGDACISGQVSRSGPAQHTGKAAFATTGQRRSSISIYQRVGLERFGSSASARGNGALSSEWQGHFSPSFGWRSAYAMESGARGIKSHHRVVTSQGGMTHAAGGALASAPPALPSSYPQLLARPFSSAGRDVNSATSAKNRSAALYAGAAAIFMLGMAYLGVPLYRMFCAATGYGGTVRRAGHGVGGTLEEKLSATRAKEEEEELERAAQNRPLRVRFDCNVSGDLPWRFRPCQRAMTIVPGQSVLAFYTVTNTTDQDVIGVSTYNVVPFKAGPYFNKVQCFCFEEQKLRAGESIDMPVFFYVDKEFAADPRMSDVHELVLSYTFYKVEQEGTGLQQLADRGLATAEQQAILAGHKATGAAQVGASAQPSG